MSYLIFDTETTGLPNKNFDLSDDLQPNIVQIAALLLNDDYEVQNELNCLIKPRNWEISYESEMIHGWSQDDCEFMGEEIETVFGYLNQLAENAHTIVAHHIDFDLTMLKIESIRNNIDSDVFSLTPFCTMKNSMEVCQIPYKYGKLKYPSLNEAALCILGTELDEDKQHDALYDTEVCAEIFIELCK